MNGNLHRSWTSEWETIAIPAVLILTGTILVCAAAFGLLSFDRMQNLWPFAVILIGLCELVPTQSRGSDAAELQRMRTRTSRDV